jgi:hypothetical protein
MGLETPRTDGLVEEGWQPKLKEEWVKLPKHEFGAKLAGIPIPVCARFGEGQHTTRTRPLSPDLLNAPAIYDSISIDFAPSSTPLDTPRSL